MSTTFLFSTPSALEGAARLLDLGGTLQMYNSALSGQQADSLAIASDWAAVGGDILSAMAHHENVDVNDVLNQAQEALDEVEELLMNK